ncbi:unnamed protein product [Symbiodinium natans]|uniref:Uncharacterized protein n=1 Tax=Symbiodinium natans TaxID=878477 RepID=A0A812V411_9DINO|nr:unnamed protein product [Symbiodinium natans]
MRRVWSRVSGAELAAEPKGTFWDVVSIKGHLRAQYHYPMCFQRLFESESGFEELPGMPLRTTEWQLVVSSTLGRPDLEDRAKEEFVMYAAKTGHVKVAQALLDGGANKDWQDGVTSEKTALMHACARGHIEMVRFLLEAGVKINLQDAEGKTALMHAADKGHMEIVHLLLEAGADRNLRDNRGKVATISHLE